ncbi:hypothetical protein ASPACDRAFT_1879144 [Aspergillus aculeatus ATCC 16872]|uniref:GPI transamidase component PIG-S n=1 Tax=Aspergillus aculeatus (strain ATCC 16872 / CBS 172.66 / WB 5094) TaxID=690307 RepID=A0A1L9X3E6_ASPA1|nr:uncharacterized protein ASPACDRAFT_1879144 [Aspergillus aculeatus ATCC 16872]OJK02992.1 hypothetical protein ASPACDRAFT_1879144 [Aspergillus aculeatus ATCC 16872]
MAIRDIVVNASLLPVLNLSAETRDQCMQLLAVLDPSADSYSDSEKRALAASKEQKQLFALLARLRGLNRDAILRVRETKQATAEARQEIDRLHLQLQNLYYEQRHLTGEIAACESYDHKYLALPLIPLEEFLALHPEHRESDEHDLMIARINHEHAEREKLEQARQELLKRKQALIAENNKRKEDLASLDQDLERFIDHVLVMIAKNEDLSSSQTVDTNPDYTMTVSTPSPRPPPPEKPEAIRTRFKVIAAFWAVIILLGFPIWWKTTSIFRASLPIPEMIDWADGKTCRPVFPLQIRVETPHLPDAEAQHLLRTTQHTLDDLNEFSAHHLRLKLSNDNADEPLTEPADTALTVRLIPQDDLINPKSELQHDITQLDVFYSPNQIPPLSSSNPPLSAYIAGELQQLFTEEKAIIAQVLSNTHASTMLSSVSPQLADSIAKRLRRSMKYADTYHLAFSLFTPGTEPSSWDIQAAVHDYITPLLQAFSPISNFTVDTQVQLYATFAPTAPAPEYDESHAAWTLKPEDLSAFINAAEWPLSPSIGPGPTINFILYVPDAAQSPLVVKDSLATSWVVPQWGGVVLLNPSNGTQLQHLSRDSLQAPFLTFSHQLLTLLGAPSTPAALPFRLQTLTRIRAASLLLSASSTMGSLARLTESLPSIPIPATVAASVATTLSHLTSACEHLRRGRFQAALADARIAETEAERSFFEKSMVGQMYFPDEHKVAVYLPLLGPIGVPLIVGLLKEVKKAIALRKARKAH